MQCVENCDDPDPRQHVLYEQPVWQTLQMFRMSPSFSIHSHKSEPLYILVGEMLCAFLSFPSAPVSDQVGLSQVFSRCFMSSYQSAGALGPFNCPKRILTTHSRNCPSPRSFRWRDWQAGTSYCSGSLLFATLPEQRSVTLPLCGTVLWLGGCVAHECRFIVHTGINLPNDARSARAFRRDPFGGVPGGGRRLLQILESILYSEQTISLTYR